MGYTNTLKQNNKISNKELTQEEYKKIHRNWSCDVKKDRMSVDVLLDKLKKGNMKVSGGYVLDADFQRNYKFTTIKESSIIESILLGIPIPTIYLSRNTLNDIALFNVIDGQHRCKSIERFISGKYRLRGLKFLSILNGKKYYQLPTFIQNQLLYDSQIDISSIDISGNEELEYEVFLRFNQETNPLTKQELLDVLYNSEYGKWFRYEFIPELMENKHFNRMFNAKGKRLKDRTLNYCMYACLSYSTFGLLESKNDTPLYVGKYMKLMKELDVSQLDEAKMKTEEYFKGFINFYQRISEIEKINYIFSREFINKKLPQGNHIFLISYLIPLTLIYSYLLEKKIDLNNIDIRLLYSAIVAGMKEVNFGDFGGVSSTSYKVQISCFNSMKKYVDSVL
ncbi:DUF262 domain-containing protein [Heyndrickxia oleronia]|uniref:DUF262 domain-containing protein n=1 Tax=Heyndrickxia oleronia TaxID=38875 RepID=UPI003F24B569